MLILLIQNISKYFGQRYNLLLLLLLLLLLSLSIYLPLTKMFYIALDKKMPIEVKQRWKNHISI